MDVEINNNIQVSNEYGIACQWSPYGILFVIKPRPFGWVSVNGYMNRIERGLR